MPLVRIDLLAGTTLEYRQAVSAGVHQAMIEAIQIPADDRFQVITEHPPGGIVYDPQYLGIKRSNQVIFIQITLSAGRKPGQKKKLYQRITELLAQNPGVKTEDVLINLIETAWENWSFGKGEAPYTT